MGSSPEAPFGGRKHHGQLVRQPRPGPGEPARRVAVVAEHHMKPKRKAKGSVPLVPPVLSDVVSAGTIGKPLKSLKKGKRS